VLVVLSLLLPAASGCERGDDFDDQVEAISDPYRFHLFDWEVSALADVAGDIFGGENEVSDNTDLVFDYFDNIERMRGLRSAIDAAPDAEISSLQDEMAALNDETAGLAGQVVAQLKVEISKALAAEGINNPFRFGTFGFPPIEAVLERPPHLLVISPRDRIETVKRAELLPEMSRQEMEEIEAQVDALGYSSLVVPLGGLSTYPSFVTSDADLRFTIDSIVHEWLHQYLAFRPLGFLGLLNSTGVRPDYDIATMNETVVGIISREIGAVVYEKYYPGSATAAPPPEEPATGFNFNRVMRETRLAVDAYLAAGEIERAEQYMAEQRAYLAANGWHIRKLNQAFFAFHGNYADGPTSVSPIGADLKTLRGQSASLKAFLYTVSGMTSYQDLENKIPGPR
jgi:hypothetical protein